MVSFKNSFLPISLCAFAGVSFGFAKVLILIFSILFLKDATQTFKKYFKATEPVRGMIRHILFRIIRYCRAKMNGEVFKHKAPLLAQIESSPILAIDRNLRKSGFDDDIIDTYMNILITTYGGGNEKIKLIPTRTITDIAKGNYCSEFNKNLVIYNMLFGIIQMKQHSALIVISIEEKYIIYFDPCIHEMGNYSKRYISKCLEFLKNDRKLKKIHWKIYKLENGPQKFSCEIECDIAVMAFAECLLRNTGSFIISPPFLRNEKNKILNAVSVPVFCADNQSAETYPEILFFKTSLKLN